MKRVFIFLAGFACGLAACIGVYRLYEQRFMEHIVESSIGLTAASVPRSLPDLDARSHYNQAIALREGTSDLLPDDRSAFCHFLAAAKKDHVKSMVEVGNYYQSGRGGITVDRVAAEGWWTRAAEAGDQQATFLLSIHMPDVD